jgi:hypothetical protein
MERALASCFLFHYVDSLLAGALTVKVIVMPYISDNIWHTCIKYSPCFTMEITAWIMYIIAKDKEHALDKYIGYTELWMNYHTAVRMKYVCMPLLFSL